MQSTRTGTTIRPRKGQVHGLVLDEEGRPIEGAWVYVTVSMGSQTWLTGPRVLPWKEVAPAVRPYFETPGEHCYGPARTRADGTFQLEGTTPLWEGNIWVYHPGHLPAKTGVKQCAERGEEVDVGRVVLAEGESVEGEVRGVNGKPVVGACVGLQKVCRDRTAYGFARRRAERKGLEPPKEWYELRSVRPLRLGHVRSARSDRDGHYSLTGLEPGVYLIAAWTEKLPPLEHEIEVPGPPGGLRPDFDLARGDSISVLVTWARTGEPCTGIPVRLWPREVLGTFGRKPVIARARTDRAGRCAFGDLKPGEYYVTAEPPERLFIGGRPHRAFETTRGSTAGGGAALKVETAPLTRLTGTVATSGGAAPEGQVKIRLRNVWRKDAPNRTADGYGPPTEARRGRFSFDEVLPGPWKVEARANGFFPIEVEIEVPEEGLDETIRIGLVPGRQATQGLVLDDAAGSPLEGVEVHCYEWFKLAWGSSRKVVTDGNGRYCLDRLLGRSDSRWVKFTRAGYAGVKIDLDETKPFPPELETVRIVRTGSIHGTVLKADGRPAIGYPVRIGRSKFRPKVETDATGRFEFKDLAPGRYKLRELKEEIEVRPAEAAEIEVRLP